MDKSYPMVGEINIKKVSSWYTDTNNTGAVLLTMPNIPRPLHELCPRNIMGEKAWEQYRLDCIKHAKYVCEICGRKLTYGAQSHELYTYSYLTGTAVFQRCVCLFGTCHAGMHSGLSVTQFKNGEILLKMPLGLSGNITIVMQTRSHFAYIDLFVIVSKFPKSTMKLLP